MSSWLVLDASWRFLMPEAGAEILPAESFLSAAELQADSTLPVTELTSGCCWSAASGSAAPVGELQSASALSEPSD